ncbi:glutamyl-tRNA synthetase [Lentinula edodes]|uniref:glutamate--tRNA ligase n=1 Tax=Lentinula lateritia TaxID=40482 RepID=A0A9W8ZSR3_9AGAR|nr:glutamyl-tRNA synthetase [Lentinula edodes]
MVLLRFAPSPTGPLHLGGLRMALYNYLYARKFGGKWILRIEDTDTTRSVPGSVEGIRKALSWAGLDYDYGPEKEGPHGPYFQSERRDLYRLYANKLIDKGQAYRCFCSADELADVKTRLARSGSNNTYDKRCLHLSDEEVARKVKAGEKFVVRINDGIIPPRPPTHDIVYGNVRDAHLSLATDPVLLKSDLFPTYHLASVVDDHEMGITHVLRGEEWLPSLPLHLDLYTHLNLTPPQFAHIPILLNPDRTKMSKRSGDVQVVDYMHRGWEPQAILNWLALAGWGAKHEATAPITDGSETDSSLSSRPSSPHRLEDAPDSTHLMTIDEMISDFDLSALTHRSSVLDGTKLEYINKHHLMRTWSTPEGLDKLANRVHGHLKDAFKSSPYTTVDNIKNAITLLEGRLTNIYDIPLHAPYLFVDPDWATAEAQNMIRKVSADQRIQILDVFITLIQTNGWFTFQAASHESIMESLHHEREKLNVHLKVFMSVLRHALTGMKDGPGIIDIVRALGHERTIARLNAAKDFKDVKESAS